MLRENYLGARNFDSLHMWINRKALSRGTQKARLLTRQTPARRDAPFRGQGPINRRGEDVRFGTLKPLNVATSLREALRRRQGTPLADFFSILFGP
jgi:hypothetical protein